jgi:uncharacterized Zn-finger protein
MKDFLIDDPCLQGIDFGDRFNFKCKFCLKNLSSRQNLREHMYIHTGLKPYVCKEVGCGQSFRQGSLLSIHKKEHSKTREGEKSSSPLDKLPVYPKLTELIKNFENFGDSVLDQIEKEEILKRIGDSGFRFVEGIVFKIIKDS